MIWVRDGVPEDLPEMARIHAAAFDRGWSESELASFSWATGGFAMVTSGGFVLLRVLYDEAEILTLAVEPPSRRSGIGEALLRAATDRAKALGARRLLLEVAEGNAPARALYAKLGFAETGRRLRYYAGREDALTLQLALAKD